MDLANRLERELARCTRDRVPHEWRDHDCLAACATVSELVRRVRRVGPNSDALVDALLAVEERRDEATLIVEVASLPLARARCAGDRDRFESLLGELAIVVAEARLAALDGSMRHRLPLLLDRAWDRVRRPRLSMFLLAGTEVLERVADCDDAFDAMLDRLVLEDLRGRLGAGGAASAGLVRAWNSVVVLLEREDRTAAERDRWKYARRVLRRLDVGDTAA